MAFTPAAGTSRTVPQSILDEVLSPYKSHCRYLKSAVVETPATAPAAGEGPSVWARGEFKIPESWYIDDTGHFNSIEFNLCYNQLVYVLIGESARNGLLPSLAMDYAEFRKRQLPDVLIVEFQSTFRKAMDSRSFRGTVAIERLQSRSRMHMLKTHCEFEDAEGGFSEGNVLLAIVNRTSRGHAE